jgi:hypothetical protein
MARYLGTPGVRLTLATVPVGVAMVTEAGREL